MLEIKQESKRITDNKPENFMKKKALSLFSVVLIVLFSYAMSWGSGFGITSIGFKATGMGGAFRGVVDDWSASFWNPAGLASMDYSEVSASFSVLSPRPSYEPNISFEGFEVGYKNGIKWYPDDKNLEVPNFGGFVKIGKWGGFTTGMSFFIPYSAKYDWDLYQPPPGYETGTPYPRKNHQIDLEVLDFHPSIARELVEDKLSAGLGLSVMFANFLYRRTILVPTDPQLEIERPYENFPLDAKLDEDGWGFGFNLGILYKLTPKIQLGISYRSPIDLGLSGKTTLDLYSPDNPWLRDLLIYKYPGTGIERYIRGKLFSQELDEEVDLSLPGDFGVGIAFMPHERITLAFDVNRVNWSRLEKINPRFLVDKIGIVGDSIISPEMLLESAEKCDVLFNWDDVTRISFGFAFLPLENLPVCGGFYFDPSPISDNTLSPILPEIEDKSGITLGIGYDFGDLGIGYNYEYQSYKERDVMDLNDSNQDGIFDNYPGSYWMDAHISHFAISYRF